MSMPPGDGILHVWNSDLEDGIYELDSNTIRRWGGDSFSTGDLLSCETVVDVLKSEHTGKGRIAGGIIGLTVAGPLGAVAGLMTGGKKYIDKLEILCTLTDGRSFTARCNRSTAAKIRSIVNLNSLNRNEQPGSFQNREVESNRNATDSSAGNKSCPACAEKIKIKARLCRFCGHKFDYPTLEDSNTIPDSIFTIFSESALALEFDLKREDMAITYSLLCQIEKKYAKLSERYSVHEAARLLDEEWFNIVNNKDLCGENATPDSVFSSQYYRRIGPSINRGPSRFPKKTSEKDINDFCLNLILLFREEMAGSAHGIN